jgi:crotonobetainyl-CoA:carnitine CoA-transferase CaiB-like acyl-CoA transferase
MVVETTHPRFGTIRQVRGPVRVGTEEPEYQRAAALHENADEVLTGLLGYDADPITELRSGGAFGTIS